MFIRELLPAPDGPMIAVSSPLLNIPDMLLRMAFFPEKHNNWDNDYNSNNMAYNLEPQN